MDKKNELKMQLKKTRRQNTPPESLDELRSMEAANYMIAEKEFGQQNDNTQIT